MGRKFSGCLGKVVLNDDDLYLSSSTSRFNIQTYGSTELGCMSSDVCASNPCHNQSRNYCVNIWEDYKCVLPGKCKNEVCGNGGRCIPNGLDLFSCDCSRTDFAGKLCEIPKACLGNPCASNQLCVASDYFFKCIDVVSDVPTLEKYIIAIVLGTIVLIAVLVGFFAARRRWIVRKNSLRHKNSMKFKHELSHGFDNLGQTREDSDSMTSPSEDLNRYHVNKSQISQSSYNDTYKNDLHKRGTHPENLFTTCSYTEENSSSYEAPSNEFLEKDKEMFLMRNGIIMSSPIQFGVNSTSTDGTSQNQIHEIYDMDELSMGFSEMSLPCQTRGRNFVSSYPVDLPSSRTGTNYAFQPNHSNRTVQSDSDLSSCESENENESHTDVCVISKHRKSNVPYEIRRKDSSSMSNFTFSNSDSKSIRTDIGAPPASIHEKRRGYLQKRIMNQRNDEQILAEEQRYDSRHKNILYKVTESESEVYV